MVSRLRAASLALLAPLLLAAQVDVTRPLFTLTDDRIVEASGIAASSWRDDLYWVHNDKGGLPVLYAVDDFGDTVATVRVGGADNVDWEDIARAPGPTGVPSLWIADTGDADADRDDAMIYVIPEPLIGVTESDLVLTVTATRYPIVYDDGPRNVEALLVGPDGTVGLVSKGERGTDPVVVSAQGLVPDVDNLFQAVALLSLEDPPPPSGPEQEPPPGRFVVTGGDVSPDGSLVVVRTYGDALFWSVPAGRPFTEAFGRTPARVLTPPARMGEGIAFTRTGRALVTSSEGERAPVHAFSVPEGMALPEFFPPQPPSGIAIANPARPRPGAVEPDSEQRLRQILMLALGASMLIGIGARISLARRRDDA